MKGQPLLADKSAAATIHDASLTVLERTGLRVDHDEGTALLVEAGATLDPEGRVLVPRELVARALGRAAPFKLWDREGHPALELACGETYFGPGSDALYQIEPGSEKRRDSRLSDVGRNVRLADALGFDFIMSMALPRDLPGPQLYPRVFFEMVRNTTRPILFTATCLDDVTHIHRIATAVAGSEQALRERPFCLAYLEPLSPLHLDRASVERLLYCADHGIPFVFASGANSGIGAPITPMGGVVQGCAESLAGLVIASLRSDDVRYVFGANTSCADMRTGMICYGATEWTRTVAIYADLARHHGLPSWGTAGCTDAQQIDIQAAWEAYRGILVALQAESTLVHDMGYMAFGEQFDPRMLVLVREMVDEARHLMKEVDLSEGSLSGAVIDEVSRKRSLYLAHSETRKRFRGALRISKLINRDRVGIDPTPILDKLGERAAELQASHEPIALDPAVEREIERDLDSIEERR
jgi:trimethylamine--corrinoid protein Co-methyltransferase